MPNNFQCTVGKETQTKYKSMITHLSLMMASNNQEVESANQRDKQQTLTNDNYYRINQYPNTATNTLPIAIPITHILTTIKPSFFSHY